MPTWNGAADAPATVSISRAQREHSSWYWANVHCQSLKCRKTRCARPGSVAFARIRSPIGIDLKDYDAWAAALLVLRGRDARAAALRCCDCAAVCSSAKALSMAPM